MKRIFVDTSGWGDLVDAQQQFHTETKTIYETAKRQRNILITTNYILAELASLLSSPLRIPRSRAVDFINSIRTSSVVDIVHINQQLDSRAWSLLVDRLDKNWSLVDCTSFVLMRQLDITEALTTDHHFEQAGFVRLLK